MSTTGANRNQDNIKDPEREEKRYENEGNQNREEKDPKKYNKD